MKRNNFKFFVISAMLLMGYNSVRAIEPDTTGVWNISRNMIYNFQVINN